MIEEEIPSMAPSVPSILVPEDVFVKSPESSKLQFIVYKSAELFQVQFIKYSFHYEFLKFITLTGHDFVKMCLW